MNVYVLPPAYRGDPEAVAMLQAFYSRSTEPINARLERLGGDLQSVKAALKRYYVGYGHESIGQCGNITLFFEGVSLLCAKALQDHPLYNGQECSTRYIDLGQGLYQGKGQKWKELADKVHSVLVERYTEQFSDYQHEPGFAQAVKAWAFDRSRGWLPNSLLTNLSLSMNLHAAREHLLTLTLHELEEVRQVATKALEVMADVCPDSIVNLSIKKPQSWYAPYVQRNLRVDYRQIDDVEFSKLGHVTHSRMRGERFSQREISQYEGHRLQMEGTLDFGSWRDLQRHRPCRGQHSLPICAQSGFSQWYLTQLLENGNDAEVLDRDTLELAEESTDAYSSPLATRVYYSLNMSVLQAIYLAELRSSQTVHPTLRDHAVRLAKYLDGLGFMVYADTSESRFMPRRGTQTIKEIDNA